MKSGKRNKKKMKKSKESGRCFVIFLFLVSDSEILGRREKKGWEEKKGVGVVVVVVTVKLKLVFIFGVVKIQ